MPFSVLIWFLYTETTEGESIYIMHFWREIGAEVPRNQAHELNTPIENRVQQETPHSAGYHVLEPQR